MHRGRSSNVTGVLLEDVVGRGRSRRRRRHHDHGARLHDDSHIHSGCWWCMGFRTTALLHLQHRRVSRRVTQALDCGESTDHDLFCEQWHDRLLSEQHEHCHWHQHTHTNKEFRQDASVWVLGTRVRMSVRMYKCQRYPDVRTGPAGPRGKIPVEIPVEDQGAPQRMTQMTPVALISIGNFSEEPLI